MSDFHEVDLDTAVDDAWREFRSRLADHLAEMNDDDIVILEVPKPDKDSEETTPYVQFCAWGDTLVRSEVSSNEYLGDAYALDADGVDSVEALGWQPSAAGEGDEAGEGSANFNVDLERTRPTGWR